MHFIQRLIICAVSLLCFACTSLQKNKSEEEAYKIKASKDSIDEYIIPEIETEDIIYVSESLYSTEIIEEQRYVYTVIENVQALLEGDWLSKFQQERRPFILLISSNIESEYAEQESSLLELIKDELLRSYAVNLVLCDTSLILSSHPDSLLYVREHSGADFLLQSRYLIENGIPFLELKLYNLQEMACVYDETKSLIKIKI